MNRKSILKFTMYVALLLLLVHPPYLETFPVIMKIYNYSYPLCIVLIGALFVYHSLKKKTVNKYCILVSLFILLPVLYTIFTQRIFDFVYYKNQITVFSLTLLFTVGIEKDFEEFLLALCSVLGGYVLINFISIVLYPNALYSTIIYKNLNWFLGYKNVMVRTMIPALSVISIYSVYKYRRLNIVFWFFYAISLLSNLMTDCKTGTLGLLLFGILLFMYRNRGVPKFFNLRTFGIVLIGITVLFSIFNFLSVFYSFLGDIGEVGSISNRVMIWQRALELIQAKPLFGYGYRGTEAMRSLMDFSLRWADVSHPHNYFFYILIQGGIALICLGTYIFYKLGKDCERYRINFISVVLFAMYVSFLTMGLVESLVGTFLLYPFIMFVIPMKQKLIKCRKVKIHI